MKVAIVHYWLVGMIGGERVIEALCQIYPQADLFTHVFDASSVSETIVSRFRKTTFIDRLPRAKKWYRRYLPLMPLALEQLDLSEYDLVISSESGPAKGVITSPDSLHVCYCHSPMRYLWDMYHRYLSGFGPLTRAFTVPLFHYLRMWDQLSADKVDHFVANSEYVARRIRKIYRREAGVIHPPVDVDAFAVSSERADFYLMAGQLTGYKNPELAVRAFNESGKRLVVIGEGEQFGRLKKLAGSNVQLLGHQPFSSLKEHYSACRALIFPGIEDFGIVPVEAMASGRPVIAFGKGGALDSVEEGLSGLFFHESSVKSLNDAIEKFEENENQFDGQRIREYALGFGPESFKKSFSDMVRSLMERAR
jgi:glycosyltransferase involved in cell wall biosynthesis